jgi:imidazolonepropionase
MKVDLLIQNASQILTCASGGRPKKGAEMRDPGIIANGAVVVDDGKIVFAGPAKSADSFDPHQVIDAAGSVVAPAFVECHTHLVYAGNRFDEFERKIGGADYLEILAAGGGILSTVRATREASLDQLIDDGERRVSKMIAHGAATIEIKTGYGLDAESELKMLRAILEIGKSSDVRIVPTFLPAHAVPPEFKGRADDYVELIITEMLGPAKKLADDFGSDLFIDVFCEKNAFDLAQSVRVLESAKALGYKIKAHVDEFTNLGGAREAIRLGASSIDHLDAISAEEIGLLAASATVGVVTPTVNFNLGSTEFADARRLIDAGCAIAVSTDYNPGSAPCPSMPMSMSIACRYQKLLPSETFTAATINAAHAVGLGDVTGSIETGKSADIVIFDCEDYREVVGEFGSNHAARVIAKGFTVYES